MDYPETLPRRGYSGKEMLKRVARFRRLKGSDGGLPDSKMPGCERSEFTGKSMHEIEATGAMPGHSKRRPRQRR